MKFNTSFIQFSNFERQLILIFDRPLIKNYSEISSCFVKKIIITILCNIFIKRCEKLKRSILWAHQV